MKFPSSACNYYCSEPRQILIMSDTPISSWCMMKRLEKPTINKPVVTSTKRDIDNEPTFTNVSGGSLDLFNYLNWVWTSKSYRS